MENSEKKEWQIPTVTDLDISETKGPGMSWTFEGYIYNQETGERDPLEGPS